jgi:hypothetical protein
MKFGAIPGRDTAFDITLAGFQDIVAVAINDIKGRITVFAEWFSFRNRVVD